MWEGECSQQRLWWERVGRLGGKSKQALNVSEQDTARRWVREGVRVKITEGLAAAGRTSR